MSAGHCGNHCVKEWGIRAVDGLGEARAVEGGSGRGGSEVEGEKRGAGTRTVHIMKWGGSRVCPRAKVVRWVGGWWCERFGAKR